MANQGEFRHIRQGANPASAERCGVKVEQEVRDLDLVLWGSPGQEVDCPPGAAAAMALVAFVAFMIGLGAAALVLL
jgi:hypothetical protein